MWMRVDGDLRVYNAKEILEFPRAAEEILTLLRHCEEEELLFRQEELCHEIVGLAIISLLGVVPGLYVHLPYS
jgi:hypothetical protein